MMTSFDKCPTCGAKIKDVSLFGRNIILNAEVVAIINKFHSEKSSHFCNKCGESLYEKYRNVLIKERYVVTRKILPLLSAIPILSLQSPLNWDYAVLGLVTAQSTTGTGVFSEITSSFTDLFGTQSNAYNKKLRDGEDMCQSILRKETLELGGNAILAADIDYAEVGGNKGMLMVCMTGTAVILQNPELLGEKTEKSLNVLGELGVRLTDLDQYKIPVGID